MNATTSNTLQMPGATLYYECRGSGPLLLLIAGGEGGADGYVELAAQLANQYTVVIYDRRGAPRSPVSDPTSAVHLETHSDDSHRLLAALTTEPAYVFGSSAGALVGLDLAIRYPDQVRKLVAHEPPVEGLLPEFEQFQDDILDTYQHSGGAAAPMKCVRQLGVTHDEPEPGVQLPPRNLQDLPARGEALIKYTFGPAHRYRLNLSALAAIPVEVVLAAGSGTRDSFLYRNTTALAERLRTTLVEFPSHHAGYGSHPRAFAGRLREVLET